MAENYQSKRERWQRQRETFPPALQDIALSTVDSIGALEEPARQLLAEVFSELESIPKAITLLDIFPDIPADMLLRFANAEKSISWQSIQTPVEPKVQSPSKANIAEDLLTLADLLQGFYPGMPRTAAEALAASSTMQAALQVVKSVRLARENAKSDFIHLCLYGLFKENTSALEAEIRANPAFLNAARQSSLWAE
ncbi:MAG: hypothetical protein HN855_10220 [Anaerolineae bacterium]|jgi:hypothetical protein|nr:hypothetical protein [Anaerolineae bacterium]MBT7325526.1 hypothetical protein [Anaerolineae bacterium]